MWTKEEIKKVLALWDSKTIQELADEIGTTPEAVSYIAFALRKNGFTISKKRKAGYMQLLLAEVKAELN